MGRSFSKLSINFQNNWRPSVFILKIITVLQYIFFAKIIQIPTKSRRAISSTNSQTFFSLQHRLCCILHKNSRDRIIKKYGLPKNYCFQKEYSNNLLKTMRQWWRQCHYVCKLYIVKRIKLTNYTKINARNACHASLIAEQLGTIIR